MKIKLGPIGNASDPWYVPPKTVEIPDRPEQSNSSKLAPVRFLPETSAPAPNVGDGLGTGPASGNCDFGEIKLAPPARGFWDGPVSGEAIKLAPVTRSDNDMFEAFGPTPAPAPAPAAKPADGEFVKADFEKFAEGGEIIERETLYSTSSGWKVQKRVVLKSGRERTVITCPGHLAII